jgi:short-subunit dehydrogenase involved in D-alanine esterification of teichoic acids
MSDQSFPYQRVLLIGATSGIGAAMADRLVREGVKVIAVGRRKDRLDDFVQRHGSGVAGSALFDIAQTQNIPRFASGIAAAYPDLDCVFLNAGIQRRYDFSRPDSVDLGKFDYEMRVNFASSVALAQALLPFLLGKPKSALIFTSSNLAIVPASPMPAYSASKAALNAFILCLRDQLRGTSVKVIELSPPVVQTELHDAEMGEEAGRRLGMPVDAFADLAYQGLAAGKDQIVIGALFGQPEGTLEGIIDKRRAAFEALAERMRKPLIS